MKNSLVVSLIVMIFSLPLSAQDTVGVDVRDVTKADFFDPGVSYEKRIGRMQTLHIKAGLSPVVYFGYSQALGDRSGIEFYPAIDLGYRYYYNAANRIAKGRRVEMNNLNYIGPVAELSVYRETVSANGDKDTRALTTVGFVWGFQRNYPKRFSLDINIGIGYRFGKETEVNEFGDYITSNIVEFTNVGQVSLGFWLNKRK